MKVISWNLGFWLHRKYHYNAWDYLREEIRPDFALLQETKTPKLQNNEHIFFKKIHNQWGTAIYSREHPIEDVRFETSYPNRYAVAKVILGEIDLVLVSIHAPIINNRVFPHLDRIFDEIEKIIVGKTFIVAGDLNSARLAEEVWPNHGHGPFFERLSDSIFFDCMRKFHEEEQQTYFRKGVSLPWQDDHVFVSHDIAERVISCDVLKNSFTQKYSDHIPIILELELLRHS